MSHILTYLATAQVAVSPMDRALWRVMGASRCLPPRLEGHM